MVSLIPHVQAPADGRIAAALRHPGVQADVWGPGWAGYDPLLSLSVNVRRRQHRLVQLERSKREFMEKREKERKELAARSDERERQRTVRWSMKGGEPSVPDLPPQEYVNEDELWEVPDWEELSEGFSEEPYDIVLTIS